MRFTGLAGKTAKHDAKARANSSGESEDDFRFVLDHRGNFEEVSEGFGRLLGYAPAELLGKPIDDITASGTVPIPQHLGLVANFGRFDGLWMFVHHDGHGILLLVEWELLPGLVFAIRCRHLPPEIRPSNRQRMSLGKGK